MMERAGVRSLVLGMPDAYQHSGRSGVLKGDRVSRSIRSRFKINRDTKDKIVSSCASVEPGPAGHRVGDET